MTSSVQLPVNLPVGELVESKGTTQSPRQQAYVGKFVTLNPVNVDSDVEELFQISHGTDEKSKLWTYMPSSGPFPNPESMLRWLKRRQKSEDSLFLTVTLNETNHKVGMVSFLNIVPEMRRLELGNIWYTPDAQRTKVNTESIYLMLVEAFECLQYRRVEWKCDSLNAKSCFAAQRLGFSFEGLFYKHMIVNNRNRDTIWFAMLDTDWPKVKKNMEAWLYKAGLHTSLSELNSEVLRSLKSNA